MSADGLLQASQVYDRLKRAILHGDFAPDEAISQNQLAAQMGVSRTPLREALRTLQSEGLVLAEPNRRVRVTSLSITDLEELYAARIVLEALAVRITVGMLTDAEMEEIDAALAQMDAAARVRDYSGWETPHRRFHELLRSRAGQRIVGMTADLDAHSGRYRRAYLAEPIAWASASTEHHAIAEACRDRDEDAASERLARHLARTALTLIATVAPEHDALPVRAAVRLLALRSKIGGTTRESEARLA